ncbi:hypothetical protein BVY01_00285 [bacterium I07]|nr:hypothetical protein BVY01_00285 [bacterium I07]
MDSLPIDHWAYDAINYLNLKGYFTNLYLGIKPWKKYQIVDELRKIQPFVHEKGFELTSYDNYLFDRLFEEFHLELQNIDIEDTGIFDYNPKIVVQSEDSLSELLRSVNVFDLSLNITQYINIQARFEIDTDGLYDKDYRGFREWKNLVGDMSLANITFGNKNIFFEIGRDFQFWGNGKTGGLILSNNMPSLDMALLQFTFWKFKYSGFFSILNRIEFTTGEYANRYLSGSRIVFKPMTSFELGISQTLIYGGVDIGIIPFYSNPLLIYYLADTMLAGDNGISDNNMVAFDLMFKLRNNIKLYGEFLIDDAIYDGSDNPNKLGYLSGLDIVSPFDVDGFQFSIEYARITKWVYGHSEKTPYKRYEFYNSIIGHWIGPDAEMLSFSGSYYLGSGYNIILSYTNERNGEGSIDSPWYDEFGNKLLKRHNSFPFFNIRNTGGKMIGKPHIVVIQKSDIFSSSEFTAIIIGAGLFSKIFLQIHKSYP